jgi:hypothetical protein
MCADIESRELIVRARQESFAKAKLVTRKSRFRDSCKNTFGAYPGESHRRPWRTPQHRIKILNQRPVFLRLFGL